MTITTEEVRALAEGRGDGSGECHTINCSPEFILALAQDWERKTKALEAFEQAITDPENQPNQFGITPPMDWRPIETAPRDGTHILVCDKRDWDQHTTFDQFPPAVVHWWNGYGDEPPGLYLSHNSGFGPFRCDLWMHLPKTTAALQPPIREGRDMSDDVERFKKLRDLSITAISATNFYHHKEIGDLYGWAERLSLELANGFSAAMTVAADQSQAISAARSQGKADGMELAARIADVASSNWSYITGNPCERVAAAIRAAATPEPHHDAS